MLHRIEKGLESQSLVIDLRDKPISQTRNWSSVLQICKTAKVMPTTNLDVADWLGNGSTGHVCDIICNNSVVQEI